MADPKVFIPGSLEQWATPLGRFLPPIAKGVVSTWLEDHLPKGAWILDPFGAAPQLAVEAAQAGYRVAVAANNPIARFVLELLAQPPSAEELQAALADLGAARRGDERLEPHILDLYSSRCPSCGAENSAQAFIWSRESAEPQAKIIHCENCGHRGEEATDAEDRARAASFRREGPHRARALERIAPQGDRHRVHAEEALEAYLPRSVYALFTILNRMDGLNTSDDKRRLLSALLLHALDRGNTLWAHPSGRARPKQLGAPPLFREHNIWRELESAIELLGREEGETPVLAWPESPEGGGISLFEGRLREMAASLEKAQIEAVVTALPRPNQAYWTLSALWAGWLWGREAIGPFASVLRRRRYDWAWHSEALSNSLQQLAEHLPEGTPLLGLITESEAGFNAAGLVAANLTGFKLQGLALRREDAQLQAQWSLGGEDKVNGDADVTMRVKRAAQEVLLARGEPSHFLHLHSAALSELATLPQLGSTQAEPSEIYSETKASLEVGLTFRSGFLRFGGSDQSLEAGQWWLAEAEEARSPLADRVEIALVRLLQRYPGRSNEEIDQAICEVFTGLLTPPRSLVMTALESYGDVNEGAWRLGAADSPKARRADLREIKALIGQLGQRLEFKVEGEGPIRWLGLGGETRYNFYVIASGLLGDLLLNPDLDAAKSVIVLPGRRAQLVLTKIVRDPRLRQKLEGGWRFAKFRHVRRLGENQSLTLESFDELLNLDPLTEDASQAPLL